MKKIFYLMLVALTMGMLTACDDNDEGTPQINDPEPKEQWGKTLRSDNQTLLAFPDIYADYWEHTCSYKDNSNIGPRLTRKFPKSHFFDFTAHNDEAQMDVPSIEDVNIQSNGSSINLYVKETDDYGASGYTVYIIPASTPASARASMKNVCEFPEGVNMISIFIHLYLAKQYGSDEYGSVDMPAIQTFNVTTGEKIGSPEHEACNTHESLNLPPMDFSADLPRLPFMHVPLNLMYPNSPAEYLFARIKLSEEEVATFRFIPLTAPKSVSEYAIADVRYWSICFGSAETYPYASIYDKGMPKVDKEGFVTFIIADANSARLPDPQAKTEANNDIYILVWDRKEQGDGILVLYRNMIVNESYSRPMRELMESVPLATVGDDMSGFSPVKMIAMPAMGNRESQGYKLGEGDFLNGSFNYASIRRMK